MAQRAHKDQAMKEGWDEKIRETHWIDEVGVSRKVLAPYPLNYSGKAPSILKKFIFNRDGASCVVCLSTTDVVLDHILSLKNGGTNHPDNLRPLCERCNSAKSALFDARNAYSKTNVSGKSWSVYFDNDERVRVGIIQKGKSLSFDMDASISLTIAKAIVQLHKKNKRGRE